MIHLPVDPGSAEWIKARLGIPTSSCFSRIVTPKGAPSRSQDRYMCELIAETILGYQVVEFDSYWTERGKELEPHALSYYELQTDRETSNGGFCLTDDQTAGCSPDRLIGEDGGLEIKCPSATQHVAYLIGMDEVVKKYTLQVQGSLWITSRRWWDILSYHESMPPALYRVERDDEMIEAISKGVRRFNTALAELRKPFIEAVA